MKCNESKMNVRPKATGTSVHYYDADKHHYQQYYYGYCHSLTVYIHGVHYMPYALHRSVFMRFTFVRQRSAIVAFEPIVRTDLIATVCQMKVPSHSMTFVGANASTST